MWKKCMFILLTCTWLISGCSQQPGELLPSPEDDGEQTEQETVPLSFSPVPVEVLEPTDAPVELIKVKSFGFSGISGSKKVMIHLYIDPQFKQNPAAGEVIAYLEDEGKLYNLGMAADNGVNGVSVVAKDSNGDGKTEVEVSGLLGSHYVELKVIAFQTENNQWVNLLTTGTAERIDLEQNGKPLLVSVSAGTVPGYVWIYRWGGSNFEMADVAESTGNQFAHIETTDDHVYIVSGTENKTDTYKYSAGQLVLVER